MAPQRHTGALPRSLVRSSVSSAIHAQGRRRGANGPSTRTCTQAWPPCSSTRAGPSHRAQQILVLGRAAPMIGCVCQLTRKPASIALCSASGTPLYQLAVLPLPLPGLVPFISPLYGLLCQRCVAGLSEHSAPQEAHSHYIHPPQPPRPLPFCFNPHFSLSRRRLEA